MPRGAGHPAGSTPARRLIGERYELLAPLGHGGMAVVWRARDTRLLREVAVKLLHASPPASHQAASGVSSALGLSADAASLGSSASAVDDEALFYFHREARAVAALRHPGIVQIFDYSGPHERPVWLVMELCGGRTLEQVLAATGAQPWPAVAAIGAGVAGALAHAHERGVVHRDLKPSNVMLEAPGRVLLMDFGIAKAFRDAGRLGATTVGRRTQLYGTPEYLAPEQVEAGVVGPASDVFALGSLLYTLAAGRSPFADADLVEVVRRIVDLDRPPLGALRPDAPAALAELIERCQRYEARRRPSAQALAADCRALLADSGQEPVALVERLLAAAEGASGQAPAGADERAPGSPTTRADNGPAPTPDAPEASGAGSLATRADRPGPASTVRDPLPTGPAPAAAPAGSPLGTQRMDLTGLLRPRR